LHDPERTAQLATHAFLGSAVRDEPADPEVDAWLSAGGAPIVYVSFGSFLSVRADVLSRVADALRQLDVRVALAIGSADRRELGELPATWLVREFLPQVTMLKHAALAVTHGGNNSVTEAATAGVPMLVLETAKPQKFAETIREAIRVELEYPSELRAMLDAPQRTTEMADDEHELRAFIEANALR
jgi:UDP:flavonoid glycosyltransferase YjiC (YdhE family)